ncbi:MAG: hypothetical protein JST26_05610 [Bacteroidetes bacterium]|nr:hypothetical protein [Bacteroidota bacterium]
MEKIHQIDIALIQLERACSLFFEGDLICALTLAGAAEEILGEIANKESKKLLGRGKGEKGFNALNLEAGLMHDFFGVNYFDYIKDKNRLRNNLKHMTPDYLVQLDELELTVKQFIGNAITNYKLLSTQLPALSNIEKFCKIVGVS